MFKGNKCRGIVTVGLLQDIKEELATETVSHIHHFSLVKCPYIFYFCKLLLLPDISLGAVPLASQDHDLETAQSLLSFEIIIKSRTHEHICKYKKTGGGKA